MRAVSDPVDVNRLAFDGEQDAIDLSTATEEDFAKFHSQIFGFVCQRPHFGVIRQRANLGPDPVM